MPSDHEQGDDMQLRGRNRGRLLVSLAIVAVVVVVVLLHVIGVIGPSLHG
jgi:hypothetical protein